MIVDPPPHPVPEAARVELERLGARWRTLPLPQALRHAPAVRALAQRFADERAGTSGAGQAGTPSARQIPDLGPATAYDQLVTLTYDVALRRDTTGRAALVEELAALRRDIGAGEPARLGDGLAAGPATLRRRPEGGDAAPRSDDPVTPVTRGPA